MRATSTYDSRIIGLCVAFSFLHLSAQQMQFRVNPHARLGREKWRQYHSRVPVCGQVPVSVGSHTNFKRHPP